jgi:3-dehydroquinate synthase
MKKFASKDYMIFISRGEPKELTEIIPHQAYSQVFVLVDEYSEMYCLPMLLQTLGDFTTIRIPAGEQHKQPETVSYIWKQLLEAHADRDALLINLGGGVICDMGGFAASTYKRGIHFIHIPTTLLAMVDAAVGGKQGINIGAVKNPVGVFAHPKMILINPVFIRSLPERELLSGFAEVAKTALVGDKKFWKQLQQINDVHQSDAYELIKKSLRVKKNVVDKDPKERGRRKVLNFGHTIGHAVESYSLQNDSTPLLHGEAIAAGMVCEAYLSHVEAGFGKKDLLRLTQFVGRHFGKYEQMPAVDKLESFLLNDKKNRGGEIIFTLLKEPGAPVINNPCTLMQVTEALNYYQQM